MNSFKIIHLLILLCLFSCKKDEQIIPEATPVETFKNGILVLNEGLFQQNNSNLSWINLSSGEVNNQLFEQKTNRQLGDTGNDLKRYGNKIYIVVNVSGTIEVLDATSGQSIKQIMMVENGTPKQPRFITFYGGKGFISCFDGFVDVLDTATLEITQRIPVGANPDGIACANNKIYVCNSGGLSYPNVDSTLSIIDPVSMTETNRIVVGKDPTRVIAGPNNNLFIISRTGFNTLNQQLVKVNAQTESIDTIYNWNIASIDRVENNFIIHITTSGNASLQLFDPINETILDANFIDVNLFDTYYGAHFNPANNFIYCFDASSYTNTGMIRVFDVNGNLQNNYQVSLNPSKIICYD